MHGRNGDDAGESAAKNGRDKDTEGARGRTRELKTGDFEDWLLTTGVLEFPCDVDGL